MARIFGAIIVFALLLGLYLFFAGEISTVEIIGGLFCAAAGTALAVGLGVVAERRFAFAPPLGAIAKPLLAAMTEPFIVGRELVAVAIHGARDQRGDFIQQPFQPGPSGDEAESATLGRRALTIIGVSLAPRSFVVRGERTDALLIHALPAKAPSPDTRWPA